MFGSYRKKKKKKLTLHEQLYERSSLARETGAAIHLAPNCHGILRRLGIYPEEFGANPVCGVSIPRTNSMCESI